MYWKEYLRLVPTETLAQELYQRVHLSEPTGETQPMRQPQFCGECGGIVRPGTQHECVALAEEG